MRPTINPDGSVTAPARAEGRERLVGDPIDNRTPGRAVTEAD